MFGQITRGGITGLEAIKQHNQASSFQARKRLLLSLTTERVDSLFVRLILYTAGCSLAWIAIGAIPSMISYSFLLICDLLDCWVLKNVVQRMLASDRLVLAERITVTTGAMQAASLSVATGIYFFIAGEDANILFVIGAMGLTAVNSAITLPKFPLVGLVRLGICAATPLIFLTYRAIELQSIYVFNFTDVSGVMLLLCMTYMFAAFTRSGMESFRSHQFIAAKEAELTRANNEMQSQQKELRKLSLVARKANDSVVLTDPERKIIWTNEAFTRVTGFSFDEAKGQRIVDLLSGNDPALKKSKMIDKAVKNGQAFHGEVENITKDNRRIWVDVNLFPVHDEAGQVEFFVAIERDITQAKNLALEMEEARRAAEDGARAKAEFLANMSHEIRTPLTGIIGMADLLTETRLSGEQHQFVRTIVGSSQSLMGVINDVLDLSQLDAGRLELSPSEFSLQDFFQDTLSLLAVSARREQLKVSLDVAPECPAFVTADESRLRQVAINLIGNAIKFTERGQVTVRVLCLGGGTARTLVFEVEDSGIGIPANKLDRIFDRFTQAEAETTRKFGGSGLGLTISKDIIEVMCGEISVTSKVGKGSVFKVSVPVLVEHASAAAASISNATSKPEFSMLKGARILIAEDNKTNRLLLSKYLSGLPVELEFAKDGIEAIAAAVAFEPDLIFMDVSMPNVSGLDATRHIRGLSIPQPCIVALTAHAFDSEMQSCLDAGMDHFLTKPIRKRELIDWIAKFWHANQARNSVPVAEEQRIPQTRSG